MDYRYFNTLQELTMHTPVFLLPAVQTCSSKMGRQILIKQALFDMIFVVAFCNKAE
jgi:hypothetical protein